MQILTLFMHCFPDLSEHLYDHYFELFTGKSLISISRFTRTFHVLLFGTHSFLSSFPLIFHVGFCELDKTAIFSQYSQSGLL